MIAPEQFEVWRYIYTLVGIIFVVSVAGLITFVIEYFKR